MQCFANCVSGNGFLGNTARQVEWPRLWRRPLLQTEELCFYQVYKLGFLARFYLKKEFHDLNKSENCSHAIKLSDAFKTRNSRVRFLAEIWVLKTSALSDHTKKRADALWTMWRLLQGMRGRNEELNCGSEKEPKGHFSDIWE